MTPADRLRAAAQVILDTAAKTTQGRWESLDNGDRLVAWDDFTYIVEEPVPNGADAAWIALLGPDNAPHLALWLERSADLVEHNAAGTPEAQIAAHHLAAPALAFADRILGGES